MCDIGVCTGAPPAALAVSIQDMTAPATLDSSQLRTAGRELLSLALMDARNHTLQLLGRFQQVLGDRLELPAGSTVAPPLWLAGHIGWLAEYWISRNPQRGMGAACGAEALRL